MPTTLRQTLAQISRLVRDDADKLDSSDNTSFVDALTAALVEYSIYYPRVVAVDVTTDANGYVDLSDAVSFPYGFDDSFIELLQVESPISTTTAPVFISSQRVLLTDTPDGQRLRVSSIFSQLTRLRHRLPHTVPLDVNGNPDLDGAMTVRLSDIPAVCWLSASIALQMLATAYTQDTEKQLLNADLASYDQKPSGYARRSKELRAFYDDHMKRLKRNESPRGVTTRA